MVQTGLREFVAVVEHGGFTAAANALDVSTSFVSRQVMRLEDRLDTRLLHRTTRTVRLSEMGRIYYERSREILEQLAALESDMTDLQQHPKGHVRITAGAPGSHAYHRGRQGPRRAGGDVHGRPGDAGRFGGDRGGGSGRRRRPRPHGALAGQSHGGVG